MKIISFENNSPCDGHLLIPCRIYCVELEIVHNDLGLNAIEKCALKLKELGVKDEKELKEFLGFGSELDLLEPILEKIETKTLPEYKKIHAHFYYNLINQEFLHFVDLERVRTIDGKELKNNIVEVFADSSFKAESLYYPKENNKSFVNNTIIDKTISTSITYHKQDTLRHAKVVNRHVLEGVYYLHAKAFDDSGKIRVECKNHPIEKIAEKLKETKWLEKWKKKQYTQTDESKPSKQRKRIRVFKEFTAFDDRLDTVEYNLKNLNNNQEKLKICGVLYDIYEQIFDETPSLKGRDLERYKAKDLSNKSMRLGFEQISKDLNDHRLNALLRYEEKVMQALAKSYPSFLQDLHDLKKYRNKDKHGDESQYEFFLTRVELERYRDEIYFLVENLLIKEREKAQENAQKEKPYERKNAEIDAQSQLSNLNAPKPLFECFVGVNLAKAKYYSKKEEKEREKEEKEREKEKMVLNFCKIFEITLFEAIQKQPKLDFKTKDELLRDYPNLGNSLREVREDFLKRAFEYNKTSLGAYVLVLLSCKYFESVFEEVQEVQEWLDFIARLIALRGHAHKITQKLKELKEEDLEKLEKQALEYFKKIANKIYPKEKR
ncbi:hypothetical protein HPSH417_04815 [Helicobacter pylori Shi417]|uniref:hypothetical protein n=1 Tax=Helicobacter pylori TaxID=210 RepID=UPI0002595BE1|nr:hypothetical protein [Helicobacter pylori]AFH98098.1 hypothetical protein HPSH417_04815 [Helicobacter pylori Shi417]